MITERDVARCMVEYGGSFVAKLGSAALAADPINMKKIKEAFPDYWWQYTQMAQQLFEVEKQASVPNNNNNIK